MAPIKVTRSHVCNCITAVQKLFHVLMTHEMFLQPKHLLYKEEQRGHCSKHLRKSSLLTTQNCVFVCMRERTYNVPVTDVASPVFGAEAVSMGQHIQNS